MDSVLIFEQAVQAVIDKTVSKPSAEVLVEALLEAEKEAKKAKIPYNFEQLMGSWRLCFITGTKKARNRAGIVLGKGRYIPDWIKIYLHYSPVTELQLQETAIGVGQIKNEVQFGSILLSLSGPAKFFPNKCILVFDFTQIVIKLLGLTVYSGYIRGGQTSNETFYQDSINKQAFFSYFLIKEKFIAARGRGGGLALWGKQ